MERQKLVEQLEIISPALSDNNMITVLTHYWFTGTRLMAYNGKIALDVALPTDFKGAAPAHILALLKTINAKEIELKCEREFIRIKVGKDSLQKLPLLPESAFVFNMPKPPRSEGVFEEATAPRFVEAIDYCLRAVGDSVDSSVPEQLGVVLEPQGERLNLYATNNKTMAHCRVKMKNPIDRRIIMSVDFCRQLVAMNKRSEKINIHIADDHCLASCGGDVMLFGNLIASERPLNFAQMIERHIPGFSNKGVKAAKMIPVPDNLLPVIERAVIISNSRLEPTKTTIAVENGRMSFKSHSNDRGSVDDAIIKIPKEQDDIVIKVDPVNLKIGYEGAELMRLNENCIIFAKGPKIFLISATA